MDANALQQQLDAAEAELKAALAAGGSHTAAINLPNLTNVLSLIGTINQWVGFLQKAWPQIQAILQMLQQLSQTLPTLPTVPGTPAPAVPGTAPPPPDDPWGQPH